MRIGIISAMKEEMQALLSEIQLELTSEKGKRTYYSGELFGREVVLVFSRWGKVAAATTTTQLINDFDIDQIVFTGVAGGMKPEINIGDIVIGHNLYQHDMDASPILPPLEIPLLKKSNFATEPNFRLKLQSASEQFLEDIHDFISSNELETFEILQPKIHLGDIASGDQFISNNIQLSKIKKDLPQVVCVEMEGAAVAQVCYEYAMPFIIIRTISDKSNENSHIDFPRFAKDIASKYALGILKNYFILIN